MTDNSESKKKARIERVIKKKSKHERPEYEQEKEPSDKSKNKTNRNGVQGGKKRVKGGTQRQVKIIYITKTTKKVIT